MAEFISIERRDSRYPEGLNREPGDLGNSTLQLWAHGYLQVIGALPHCSLIRPATRDDRDKIVRQLMDIDYD